MERFNSQPDALRVMEGYRNSGYTPQSAIADLIDNSISAGATKVAVLVSPKVDGTWKAYIADNGCGMNKDILVKAMQYGSSQQLGKSNLNVYGLGMKVASSSFSRRFTVVSRGTSGESLAATWDLDEMIEHPWEFTMDSANSVQLGYLNKTVGDKTGTVVIWENADFNSGTGTRSSKKVDALPAKDFLADLKSFLEMTFCEYLKPDNSWPTVEIYLNEDKLSPWFHLDPDFLNPNWDLITDKLELTVKDKNTELKLPYILHTGVILGKNDEEEVVGAKIRSRLATKNQGIYVYRLGRLIAPPSWLNTIPQHATRNQLRAVLEIDPRFDGPLKLTFQKDSIELPDEMWEDIRDLLSQYDQSLKKLIGKKKRKKAPADLHGLSSAAIESAGDLIDMPTVTRISEKEVEIEGLFGPTKTEIRDISGIGSRATRIQMEEDLEGGVLFEPVLHGADQVVLINKSHPFYQKIYIALKDEPLAIQGLDFLLFSLANAEWMTRTDRVREQFTQMRMTMGMTLRNLVAELETDDDEDEGSLDE